MGLDIKFLDLIQLHERKWGETQYPGRPALTDLMKCLIVCVWTFKGRFMFTVHREANEVNELVYNVLTGENVGVMADWKLAKIFVNQEPIKFKLRIVGDSSDPTKSSEHDRKLAPPEAPQTHLRIAAVNSLRTPKHVAYVDDHDVLMAKGKVIKTHLPNTIKPGRDVKLRDGRKAQTRKPPNGAK